MPGVDDRQAVGRGVDDSQQQGDEQVPELGIKEVAVELLDDPLRVGLGADLVPHLGAQVRPSSAPRASLCPRRRRARSPSTGTTLSRRDPCRSVRSGCNHNSRPPPRARARSVPRGNTPRFQADAGGARRAGSGAGRRLGAGLEQPVVLDGHADRDGGRGQQVEVARSETGAARPAVELEDPDRPAARPGSGTHRAVRIPEPARLSVVRNTGSAWTSAISSALPAFMTCSSTVRLSPGGLVSPSRRRIARGFNWPSASSVRMNPHSAWRKMSKRALRVRFRASFKLSLAAEGAVDLEHRPEHLVGPVHSCIARPTAGFVERLQDGCFAPMTRRGSRSPRGGR